MVVTTALLADAAVVADGKLYVHGGGWDTIYSLSFPTTQPTLAVALLIRVEYSEALTDLPVRVELLDEDENPAGPSMQASLNIGHPAGMKPGTPLFIPQAITLKSQSFARPGEYRFKISSGAHELASIPFRLAPLPAAFPPASPSISPGPPA